MTILIPVMCLVVEEMRVKVVFRAIRKTRFLEIDLRGKVGILDL